MEEHEEWSEHDDDMNDDDEASESSSDAQGEVVSDLGKQVQPSRIKSADKTTGANQIDSGLANLVKQDNKPASLQGNADPPIVPEKPKRKSRKQRAQTVDDQSSDLQMRNESSLAQSENLFSSEFARAEQMHQRENSGVFKEMIDGLTEKHDSTLLPLFTDMALKGLRKFDDAEFLSLVDKWLDKIASTEELLIAVQDRNDAHNSAFLSQFKPWELLIAITKLIKAKPALNGTPTI